MRTPLRDGTTVRLLVADDGSRVDAVMVMKAAYNGESARFDLAIAARHIALRGQYVGDEILDCFESTCRAILVEKLLVSGAAVSHVHRSNTPMQVLLRSRGWTRLTPEDGDDPDYEYWGAIIVAV